MLSRGRPRDSYAVVGCAARNAGGATSAGSGPSRRGRDWPLPASAAHARRSAATWRRIASDPENESLRDPPPDVRSRSARADGTQLHAEVFGPTTAPTIVLAHGWTEMLTFWTYVIRDLSARGSASSPTTCAVTDRASARSTATTRSSASARTSRPCSRRCVPDGRRAVVAGHSLGAMSIAAWAEHHDVAGARCRRGADQHRRRGPDRRVSCCSRVPRFAQRSNRASPSAASSARARRCRASRRRVSHAADSLHRVRPGGDPGPDRLLRADAHRLPAGRAGRRSGSRCPSWTCTTRSAHLTVPTLVIGRRQRPADAAVACPPDRRDASRSGPADRAAPTPGTWARSSAPRVQPRDRKARRTIRGRARAGRR